jgi:hypothetical protein
MARYSTKRKPQAKPHRSLSPVWLIVAGVGLVLAALLATLGGGASNKGENSTNIEVNGAPRLKVEKDTIDHGDVKLGTPVRDTVRVTNIGDQPLRFSEAPYIEVKEGC